MSTKGAAKGVKKVAKKNGRIAWAMDPFADLSVDRTALGQFLYFLGRSHKTNVQPYYVLAPDSFNWTGDFSGQWFKKFQPMAEQSAARLVATLHAGNVLETKVLMSPKPSIRADIKRLIAEVKKNKSDMVVVQSHGRVGVSRAVLGSFAETLLLQSPIPVMVLNGATRPPSHVKKVFLPTDLSQGSAATLKKLVPTLKEWGACVVLYHKLPDPIEPIIQSGVYMAGGWLAMDEYLKHEKVEREAALRKWQADLVKAKVESHLVVDDRPGLMSDAVLKAAVSQEADLVAMATKAGPLGAALLGSVARQVVREAQVPVLVLRSS